ncbi:MAG: chemotaxis protein CheB [Myxococcota bacterium]
MRVRVLVADDSAVVRALLSEIIRSSPDFELCGVASNGREACERVKELRPGLVTMDVRMPELDGFDATRQIMTECPTPIVIITGHLDANEMATSMRALEAGALALLPKPPGPDDPKFDRSRTELLRTLKAMAGVRVVRRHARRKPRQQETAAPPVPEVPAVSPSGEARPYELIAIGSSTGGPSALLTLIRSTMELELPSVAIVQHISDYYAEGLASWLSEETGAHIEVLKGRTIAQAGRFYLGAPRHHIVAKRGEAGELCLDIEPGSPVDGALPSASVLLESAATACGNRALGILLTGMGRDGADGCGAIHRAGGTVVVQDEMTSIVFGMPSAVIEEGHADYIMPIQMIGALLETLLKSRRRGP